MPGQHWDYQHCFTWRPPILISLAGSRVGRHVDRLLLCLVLQLSQLTDAALRRVQRRMWGTFRLQKEAQRYVGWYVAGKQPCCKVSSCTMAKQTTCMGSNVTMRWACVGTLWQIEVLQRAQHVKLIPQKKSPPVTAAGPSEAAEPLLRRTPPASSVATLAAFAPTMKLASMDFSAVRQASTICTCARSTAHVL